MRDNQTYMYCNVGIFLDTYRCDKCLLVTLPIHARLHGFCIGILHPEKFYILYKCHFLSLFFGKKIVIMSYKFSLCS